MSFNDKEVKLRKKKVGLNLFGARKRAQTNMTVPQAPRRKSIMQPLSQRIKQYRATEEFYEHQLQLYKAVSEAQDILGERETEMADCIESYCDSNMSRSTTNAHALDLIDICDQLGANLKRLSDLKKSLNQSVESEAVSRLDELILASKAPSDLMLNINQLDVETEHALTLRNVGLSRSLVALAKNYTAYFEQGANIMRTMKVIIESIETRSTPLPSRTPSTTLIFGRPLRKVMGRYHELGTIPAQIEHCLRYVEKNCYDQPGVYRINGHASEVERIKDLLDGGEFPDFDKLEINNKGHSICGVIKLYVRELPEPLLTYDKFDDFVEAAKEKNPEEQLQKYKKLVGELPELHTKLLKRLIDTFKLVVANEENNKMNANSIAISFGMNMMRLRTEDQTKLLASTQYINKICEYLINHSELFDDQPSNPIEFTDVSSCDQITPRGGRTSDDLSSGLEGLSLNVSRSLDAKLISPLRRSVTEGL